MTSESETFAAYKDSAPTEQDLVPIFLEGYSVYLLKSVSRGRLKRFLGWDGASGTLLRCASERISRSRRSRRPKMLLLSPWRLALSMKV
jgi:hypothetical protein